MKAPSELSSEFEGLEIGDKRLERRAKTIIARVAAAPSLSFPEALPTSGELEGAYRFFQNDAVSAKSLLAPHVKATIGRMRSARKVRLVHDTTGMAFGGAREGLGAISKSDVRCGFWAHVALAVSADEARVPLGVVQLDTKVYPTPEEKARRFQERRRRHDKALKKNRNAPFPPADVVWKGFDKWASTPLALQRSGVLKGVAVVHVMDQEADNSEVFEQLAEAGCHFVIRGSASRRVRMGNTDWTVNTRDRLALCDIVLKRRVRLNARQRDTETRARRFERDAVLSVRATAVTLVPASKRELKLNVVEVLELRPPKGEEPVNWVLYTTEPIDTPEQIAEVVDHYRARWRIEEFFKVLKTGCSMEKRQLTTFDGLLRALSLFVPVAWHMFLLRTAAQQDETLPAAKLLTPSQLIVLRALALDRNRRRLPADLTVHDAILAIAALGGHLKRNGDPGWLTIARGYRRLGEALAVWRLADAFAERSDQS
jgi:hypothetical protein